MKTYIHNTEIAPCAYVLSDDDALFVLYLLNSKGITTGSTLTEYLGTSSATLRNALSKLTVNRMVAVSGDMVLILPEGRKLLRMLGFESEVKVSDVKPWMNLRINRPAIEYGVEKVSIKGEEIESRSKRQSTGEADSSYTAAA